MHINFKYNHPKINYYCTNASCYLNAYAFVM